MTDIEHIRELEAFFRADHEKSHEILDGKLNVMVSAPHCVSQTRNGREKVAEVYTGVLAKLLNEEISCPVIYKTKNAGDDANYDKSSPYKDELRDYVKEHRIGFLLDLHELSPVRKIMIDIGTGNFKNIRDRDRAIVNQILYSFGKYKTGIIQLDSPFAGAYHHTVSSTIHRKCGIPCIQLELNSRLLYNSYKEFHFDGVFLALKETVAEISNLIRERE